MSIVKKLASGIMDLVPYRAGKTIAQIGQEIGIDVNVKLSANENPLGTSPKALEALSSPARMMPSLYPDSGAVSLRAAISDKLGINAELITCGNGSNDMLELAATLTLRPGRKAVYSEHGFVVYRLATLARGAEPVVVPARKYGHDLDAMAEASSDPDVGVVYVANPNNPTGTWHEPDRIARFVAKIPEDVLVVLDEAYLEYVEQMPGENLKLVELHDNLLITRTFSKIHGLAGLRIGYGIAGAELSSLLNRVRQPFNANASAQLAAAAALSDDSFVERSIKANEDGLLQLQAGLANLGYVTIPTHANFICFVCDDGSEVFKALLQGGVITRQIDEYGLPNWIRTTIGTHEQNRQLLDALPARKT